MNSDILRPPTLSEQVTRLLIKRMRAGDYPPGSQLPPENTLAEEFSVSRATIRSAIRTLATRGLVVRRQGAGTFVSQLSGIPHPLNQVIEFNEMIASSGCTPSVRVERVETVFPDQDVAKALRVDPEEQVINLRKVFFADGKPIIYVINSISFDLIGEGLYEEILEEPQLTEPLYDFLKQRCHQKIVYNVSTIRADIGKNCLLTEAEHLPDMPVLIMQETGFNESENPVVFSLEYFPGDSMAFSLIRRFGLVVD